MEAENAKIVIPPELIKKMYPSGAGNALLRKWNSKFWTWNHLKKIYFIPILTTVVTLALIPWLIDTPYSNRKEIISFSILCLNILARIAVIIAPVSVLLTGFDTRNWEPVKLSGLSRFEYAGIINRYVLLNACLPYLIFNYLWGIEFVNLGAGGLDYAPFHRQVLFFVITPAMAYTQVILAVWFAKRFRTMLALVVGASLIQAIGATAFVYIMVTMSYGFEFLWLYTLPEAWLDGSFWTYTFVEFNALFYVFGYLIIALIVSVIFFSRLDLPLRKLPVYKESDGS